MGKEIYNIINDMAEVLNASQMQKLQEVLVNRLSENRVPDYLQTRNEKFLDIRRRNLLIRLAYQDRQYQNGKVNKPHPI